jgi:hypothetical protein
MVWLKLLPDLLKENNVLLAILHHLLHGLRAVVQKDVPPHVILGVNLPFTAEVLSQVVQPIRVELEPTASDDQGIHCLVDRGWIQLMEQAPSLEPREVELVPVVGNEFIRLVSDLNELFAEFSVIPLVPFEVFYFLGTLPLVASTDDSGLLDDVVVRDVDPPAGSPEHSDTWANFEIPNQSIDLRCIHSFIFGYVGRLLRP